MKLVVPALVASLLVPSLAWADGPDDDGSWTDDEGEASDAPEEAPPAPVPTSDPAATARTTSATAIAPGMVRLYVESPKRVSIYETHGRGRVGRKVCESPCGEIVDGSSGESFIVRGKGVNASPSFTLEGLRGDARLIVDPGSRGRKAGGIVMTVFGGIGVGAGLLLGGIAIFDDQAKDDQREGAGILGGASFLVGSGLLAGGIALIASSGTQVEVVPRGSAPSVETDDEPSEASLRERRPAYWRGEF